MSQHPLILAIAIALAVAGCATHSIRTTSSGQTTGTSADGGTTPPPAGGRATEPGAKTGLVQLTPFSDMELKFGKLSEPQPVIPSAYTRLLIRSKTAQKAASNARFLGYDQRNWLKRLFFGRRTSTNLTISVTAGSFTATVPLVSIDHVSNKSDGESFNRIVYHQAESFPLFLVKGDGSNGIVSVRASVKVTNQVQSGLAGAALEVAQGVVREVAPQSAVLTTLNQQSGKNVASALDTAVNKLFAASVDEQQWVDNDIRLWKKGVRVTLRIPSKEDKLPRTESNLDTSTYPVGTWVVRFAHARPSVFSDIDVCPKKGGDDQEMDDAEATDNEKTGDANANNETGNYTADLRCMKTLPEAARAAEETVNIPDVLAFKLTNGSNDLGTVRAYVAKQDWYITAIKKFSKQDPTATELGEFCQSMKGSVAGLELNSVDQGIITYAVIQGMSVPGVSPATIKDAKGCHCQYDKCPAER